VLPVELSYLDPVEWTQFTVYNLGMVLDRTDKKLLMLPTSLFLRFAYVCTCTQLHQVDALPCQIADCNEAVFVSQHHRLDEFIVGSGLILY